jgi:hypothetical protein
MRRLAIQANDDAALHTQRQLFQKISYVRAFGHVQRQHATIVGRQSGKLGMQMDLDLHRLSVATPGSGPRRGRANGVSGD